MSRGSGVHRQGASLVLCLSHLTSQMAAVTEPCWVQAPGHLSLTESTQISLPRLEEVESGSWDSTIPASIQSEQQREPVILESKQGASLSDDIFSKARLRLPVG